MNSLWRNCKRATCLAAVTCAIGGFASCKKSPGQPALKKYSVVYVETNDYHDNQNAVLAYADYGDGKLALLTNGTFPTGGSGVGNPEQALGPLDSDFELARSSDGKYLLAVNSGSNSIAVFTILGDGSLSPVPGSPFLSHGETPVSIDVSGNEVFVVNKSQDPVHPTTTAPNYASFTIDASGKLTPVAGGIFEVAKGTSPTQALVSNNKKFLFGTDFLGFMLEPQVGTLRSFSIGDGGKLKAVAGTPYILASGAMPPDNGALGLYEHPTEPVLYVGIPLQGKVGVYNINQTNGKLTLQTTVAAGAAACWIRTNKAGDRMYVLNSANNAVQVYNTSNAKSPVSLQTLELKNSGPEYPGPGGAMFKTSQDFSLAFSPDEKSLYVVCQHTNKDFSIGNFNYLHALKLDGNGALSEPAEALQLPVANTIRPKGSLVVTASR